jgi:hypothetical protein
VSPRGGRALVLLLLVDALRDGGHGLHLRHAQAPEDGTDQPGSFGVCVETAERSSGRSAAGPAGARG